MKYNEYLSDCIDFAEKSASWNELDHSKPFITTNGNGWQETCDNANGGIDVSWAFHLTADEIRADAPQQYADAITELVQLAIDDEWTADQLQSIVDQFS